MAHIVIGHVIGTATLLMMFFAVGSYYQGYYSMLAQEAYDSQLKEVSNYLASNVIDLITITQMTPGDQFLVKQVRIPYSISENLYDISLTWMPSSNGDFQVARLTTSIPKLNRYVTVDLPYSSNSIIKIFSNEHIPNTYLLIDNHVVSNYPQSKAAITQKATSLMVWCMKSGDVITIGFGVIQLN